MPSKEIKEITDLNNSLGIEMNTFLSQEFEKKITELDQNDIIKRDINNFNNEKQKFLKNFRGLQKLLFNNISAIKKFIYGIKDPLNISLMSQKNISNLSKRGNEIENIVKTVAKIADNTNLLSLNAAIEAAKAGKSGKGFSILSGMIRKLARNIEKLTNDIRDLTNEVQNGLKEAVHYFDNATSHTNDIFSMGSEIIEDFNYLENTISESNELFNNINNISKEYNDYVFLFSIFLNQMNNDRKKNKITLSDIYSIFQEENKNIIELLFNEKNKKNKLYSIEELKDFQKNIYTISHELLSSSMKTRQKEEIAEDEIEKKYKNIEKIETRFQENNNSILEKIVGLNDTYMKDRELLEDMVMKISDIKEFTDGALNTIKKLKEFTGKIDRLVDEVIYITIQITLLSVNGAIESANAGEDGKGFAMVSSDVQELAEASSSHAAKIKDMLWEIQGELNKINEDVKQGILIAKQQTSDISLISSNLDKTTLDIALIITQLNDSKKGFSKMISKKENFKKILFLCKKDSRDWLERIIYFKSKTKTLLEKTEQINSARKPKIKKPRSKRLTKKKISIPIP